MADLGAHTRSPHARPPHILVTLLYAFLLSRIPGLHHTPLPRAIRQIASECISTTGLLVKLPYDTVTFPSPALDHATKRVWDAAIRRDGFPPSASLSVIPSPQLLRNEPA
ncbi:hypothetical protein DFP72DRAFT_1069078 [Ephemerocybe angulata]|uniref:Uncharacterized protein n=1 Tax=Ephemerocybe angulata TaxID=980116 RepID=A0A8H6HVZ5_9AGAR|nr:hypothetical protein DFP72DRAFT_1069078 [Tulosesus angulatus]